MTAVAATAGGFSMGRVVSRLFETLGRNAVAFFLLAVLLMGLPDAILTYVRLGGLPGFAPAASARTGDFSGTIGLSVLSFLVVGAANAVLLGAVIHGAVSDLGGRKANFGECLATGLRFFVPLIGVGILAAVGTGLGYVLFIVPGVILSLVWSVAAPALVMERTGVLGALGRSRDLTRGHRGAILILAVIFSVGAFIAELFVGGVFGLGFGFDQAASFALKTRASGVREMAVMQVLVQLVVRTLTSAVGAAGVASIYFELRQAKDGLGAAELAAVFD
ncbi:MAG: hypothetical protein ACREEW_14175 [Caulobacteraceae bacterium]